ncbi:MAG: hypothetical protein EA339_05460 [Rhodobacteraceae bacterium]|nr:MAG: hypothetical protein EA339_05460 [Paracoccaceae bacterium]
MISTTIGDMSRQLMLSRQTTRMKQSISTFSQEMSSGIVRDKVKHIKGDVTMLASLEQKIAATQLHKNLSESIQTILGGQQTVIESMRVDAERISVDTLAMKNSKDSAQISRTISLFRAGFEKSIDILNTKLAGRGLFSGDVGREAALAPPDVILSELKLALPPGLDVDGLSDFVDSWFSEGNDFDAFGYIGGEKISSEVNLGNGISINPNTTANDKAFRVTLAGYAKVALLSETSILMDVEQRRDMLDKAAITLMSGAAELIDLSARIGTDEESTSIALVRAGAEHSALSIARSELITADPHETAIKLQHAMTQLDLIFSITARLSRFSLADYLR